MIEGAKKRFYLNDKSRGKKFPRRKFIPLKFSQRIRNNVYLFFEDFTWKKSLVFLGIFFLIMIFLGGSFFGGFFLFNGFGEKAPPESCGDGTSLNSCSERNPYFCNDEGVLISKSSECGCPDNLPREGESCLYPYRSNPEEITLNYTLRGEEKSLSFTVYNRLTDYLSGLPVNSITVNGDENVSRTDFKKKDLEIKEQKYLLEPLVVDIQNEAPSSKVDQARISIAIVQELDWGWSGKTTNFRGFRLNYSRYPYEVLTDQQGVCGEKSELLAFLLKEIGYETALFYNQEENHESIGIKCPVEESWNGTGYCFVETTGPSIMTDTGIIYTGGLVIDSQPEVLNISEGDTLPEGLYEYKDAERMMKIREDLNNGGIYGPIDYLFYNKLKKKYNLAEEYNPV